MTGSCFALPWALVFAAACGASSQPAESGRPQPAPAADAAAAPTVESPAPSPLAVPIEGVEPFSWPCVYHDSGVGRPGYFECTTSEGGLCLHFAGPCEPDDRCMYDPQARSYRRCDRADAGICESYGAACVPADGCMYNPADRRLSRCEKSSEGRCTTYGAHCEIERQF